MRECPTCIARNTKGVYYGRHASTENRPTRSDRNRLERLARVAIEQGDFYAHFLLDEINRSKVVPDDDAELARIVTMGSWVTYWTNWGFPRETRQLVWPDEYSSGTMQISVLSPVGAALIGLRVGAHMPFYAAGCINVVRIADVDSVLSNVVSLFGPNEEFTNGDPIDDDPGPTAA